MKQFRLLTLLALLMTAATGAWATDGIACSASDIGKVLCTDGSIYATVGDATTAQKTAAAMIAYIDATNNKGLAIALADESGTKDYEAAGTACSGKAAVTGGTWRLPSDKDWQYMFIGCGSSESYSAPTYDPAMSKSYSGLASKLTTAQGAALQSDFYWSSTKDEPNGAWGVVFDGSNATFYMEDKTEGHKVRACLAFDVTSTYTVSMKDGVKDADKWTVKVGEGQAQALPIGGLKGDGSETVTLQYNGRLKVKGVKATSDAAPAAPTGNIVDLSKLTENTELKDGDVLTGTLAANVKISIADGATVTLDGVTINGVNDNDYKWAGITCLGDATIILTGENTVKGFMQSYPGIYVPVNKTVTIQGSGSLTASSSDISGVGGAGIGSGYQLACGNITIMGGSITAMGSSGAAGIGSGNNGSCGNITITGGTINASANTGAAGIGSGSNGSLCGDITITGGDITATGGSNAAGIGSGNSTSCGNITITGGTINATGTTQAAGIGSGYAANNKTASCGTITITNGVTSVTATKGNSTVPNSIGVGKSGNNNATNTCGTVTIGCTLDTNGNPVGGTTGAISESPYTYQPSN